MHRLFFILLVVFPSTIFPQEVSLSRIEPPSWWTGFKQTDLQLMVYGKNIASSRISVDYPGFTIRKISKVTNPNYLFLDMTISPAARPGIATILLKTSGAIGTIKVKAETGNLKPGYLTIKPALMN